MNNRIVLLLLALGGLYAWQHHFAIRHWWRAQTGAAAVAGNGINVYTAHDCSPCDDAVALLQGAGLPVAVRNIDDDAAARAEFDETGADVLPLIVDGAREMRGFNAELLNSWYVERARTAQKLDELGVYRAGEPRLPVLFGTSWCPYCAQARKYFAAHGIAFRDLDIEHDPEAKRQYDALGLSGTPVMVYEDMVWNGFSAQSMDEKLKWVGNDRG